MCAFEIRSVVFENEYNLVGAATSSGYLLASDDGGKISIASYVILKNIPDFSHGAKNISLLGNSNIIALTPNVQNPTTVHIFDKNHKNSAQELTLYKFNDTICGIRLRPDILIVASSKRISVHQLSNSQKIVQFETAFNKDGVFDIPATFSSSLIAYPSTDIGVVSVCNYLDSSVRVSNVHAFKTPVCLIKFSDNGRLLAVAGDDGKNIIIYSVPSMKQVAYFKRGLTGSKLLSMAFEPHGTQLAVTSVNGTIHVFYIAWAESGSEQDQKTKAIVKIKDSDTHPSWIYYSSKSLKLGGFMSNGQAYTVVFDDQMKQATLDIKDLLKTT